MKARVVAAEQLHGLLQSAPEELRAAHSRRSTLGLARACAGLRPGALRDPEAATKAALRSIARRLLQLQKELDGPG